MRKKKKKNTHTTVFAKTFKARKENIFKSNLSVPSSNLKSWPFSFFKWENRSLERIKGLQIIGSTGSRAPGQMGLWQWIKNQPNVYVNTWIAPDFPGKYPHWRFQVKVRLNQGWGTFLWPQCPLIYWQQECCFGIINLHIFIEIYIYLYIIVIYYFINLHAKLFST